MKHSDKHCVVCIHCGASYPVPPRDKSGGFWRFCILPGCTGWTGDMFFARIGDNVAGYIAGAHWVGKSTTPPQPEIDHHHRGKSH